MQITRADALEAWDMRIYEGNTYKAITQARHPDRD